MIDSFSYFTIEENILNAKLNIVKSDCEENLKMICIKWKKTVFRRKISLNYQKISLIII